MSDKSRDVDKSGERRSVPEGCPYRFVPDEWLEHGLPPKTDPRRFTFVIICNHCKARKTTLQEMKQHFKICPNKTSHLDLTCGHCRYSTQSWAHMCVHLNQPGMHLEKPCLPEFASPEIPPRSSLSRVAEPPSAALSDKPVVTSSSPPPLPAHSATGISTSILDLPNVKRDDADGQILPPLGSSRSPSPHHRDFLGVTSQTVSDPLELAHPEPRAWQALAHQQPPLVLNQRWVGMIGLALVCHPVH